MVKISGHEIKEILADVSGEYVFYMNDGKILRNMDELGAALNNINEELYAYHVNSAKNDFSSWVKDVICDEKLARDLQKAKDRATAAKIAAKRLAFLRSKI